MSPSKARAQSEASAARYASKQHRFRAETIVHTELAFAYNRGAHEGILAAHRAGLMNRCEMVWSTAEWVRQKHALKPPLHPRCRCTIEYRDFVFDPQRFGGQRLPEGNYNLTLRRQVQNRHIEGAREYQEYATKLSEKNLMPSKMPPETDAQALVSEFHGKGIYDPNPKDNSPREKVDTGRIIGQYWDRQAQSYVDTAWLEIVYSKRGTHVYPIRPLKED